jgi:YNFM family putative membrane transporter
MAPMKLSSDSTLGLQAVVFFLVAAAFTTIYITQPVLPVLGVEFQASASSVSLTVSAVILGIAVANMPFGTLADRVPVHRILLAGGGMVCLCSFLAAATGDLWTLVGVRFVQGLFIPALTTCLAAYLARTLPLNRLNVVMGSYVSATVMGGLGGRILGGWLHPPAHWRYAFVTAGVLLLIATVIAAWRLREPAPAAKHSANAQGVLLMLSRPELLRIFVVAFSSFFAFSSVFNYLPFHLSSEPMNVKTEYVTALYLTYIVGIFIGPLAGGLSNRFGNGLTMAGGAGLFAVSLSLTLLPSVTVVAVALTCICAGYFAVHAAAVGALNRRMSSARGRANALYVLFYYVGGTVGITVSGFAWSHGRWPAVVLTCLGVLLIPIGTGLMEHKEARRQLAEQRQKSPWEH